MHANIDIAPALQISQWLGCAAPITLASLRGRVVVLHAFQMLCPGCVAHGIPQAMRVHHAFEPSEVTVLGLHTVFEHHAVMGPDALKVFMHEYRLAFPVAIDAAQVDSAIPLTMQSYALRGTPSMIVIDRNGTVRLNHFGQIGDLELGALLGQLLSEPVAGQVADANA